MDDFPKNRGDAWSGQGRTDARRIADDSSFTWLRKRRVNVQARNKGGYLTVDTTLVGTAAYFTSALSGRPGYHYIAGSTTARGTFGVTRTVATDADANSNDPVFNLGGGFAGLARLDKTAFQWTVGPSGTADKYQLNVFATRNGRDVTPAQTATTYATIETFASSAMLRLGAGVVGLFGDYARQSEYATVGRDDLGRMYAQYIRRRTDIVDVVRAEPLGWRRPVRPIVVRVGPNSRLMLRRYVYATSDPDTGIPDTLPPANFAWSTDAGATWTDLPVTEFDADLAAVVAGAVDTFPTVEGAGSALAPVIQALSVQCAPLNGSKALIMFVVPQYHPESQIPGFFSADDVVKMAQIDLSTGTFSNVATVWDSRTDSGFPGPTGAGYGYAQYFMRGLLPVKGGVLVSTIPQPLKVDGSPNYSANRLTQFTPDGITFFNAFTMPTSTAMTGRITALSPEVLVCPMYGAGWRLYETRDLGASWNFRALIYEGADVPVPLLDGWEMQSFNSVVAVRTERGDPAPFNPAAPWTHDARLAPPLL